MDIRLNHTYHILLKIHNYLFFNELVFFNSFFNLELFCLLLIVQHEHNNIQLDNQILNLFNIYNH